MIALVVVLAALCSQQVLSAPPARDSHADLEACMQETGTTYEEIFAWADGGDASENMKCQFKCMMLTGQTMTEDGHFAVEMMMEIMPSDQHPTVKECVDFEQGGEMCELAFLHHKCFREKSPEYYTAWLKKMTAAPQ